MNAIKKGKLRLSAIRLFSERQIFFRSRGRVRFFRLSRGVQIALLAVLVSVVGWAAFASAKFVQANRIAVAMEKRLSGLELDYRALSGELEQARSRVALLGGKIDSKQREIAAKRSERADLVEQKSTLEGALGTMGRELDTARRERTDLIQQNSVLIQQKSALDVALEMAIGDLRAVAEERDAAHTRLGAVGNRVARLELALRGTVRTRDRFTSKVDKLENQLARLKPAHTQLVARMQEYAEVSTGDLEAMIALTGLDTDALLDVAGPLPPGQGGPFIDIGDLGGQADKFAGLADGFGPGVAALEFNFNRWNGLQSVLKSLPLASPVDSYYVSSKFGKRIDPFTKRKAMHYGIDLAGALRSPVWSTARGIVVEVGSGGPFGGSVEIDNGHGITTRYSHLDKILVEKGEIVPFRHKIGLMGNTGRSTGSHVHYEVIFKGVPQDPARFIKAGKYVFKT